MYARIVIGSVRDSRADPRSLDRHVQGLPQKYFNLRDSYFSQRDKILGQCSDTKSVLFTWLTILSSQFQLSEIGLSAYNQQVALGSRGDTRLAKAYFLDLFQLGNSATTIILPFLWGKPIYLRLAKSHKLSTISELRLKLDFRFDICGHLPSVGHHV